MHLKILSCEVLARELYYCAATSPHIVDIELFKRGLHDTPDVLRAELQERITAADAGKFDAIALGYGLCGNSVVGLRAGRLPMIVPRAHDCITLFLGSRQAYQAEFNDHPGTYYYTLDFVERNRNDGSSIIPLGASNDARRKEVYDEYVEKYGKENADYLLEVMGGWTAHYNRAAYIDMGVGDNAAAEEITQKDAAAKGWTFARLAGALSIMRKLADGNWDDDFLRVPPGAAITATYDDGVIGCRAARAAEGKPRINK